jgi:hypothetical protein
MAPVYLDHIVILLPHEDVVHPPKWLTDYFTITPGGRHAGGQTHNKLIVFQDGSYIELIAFVDDDPKHRAGHRWGNKQVGIIDFALITKDDAENHYKVLKDRLEAANLGVKYEPPTLGGRKRGDGKVLEWKVTVPEPPVERGETPFFCHDVTPRELRVPFSSESTSHKSGAYGITELKIYVPKERVGDLSKAYSAILEVENRSEEENVGVFEVGSLHSVEDENHTILSIQEPTEEWQKKAVAERGILLGDLQIGRHSPSSESDHPTRLDREYNAGRIFLQADAERQVL